MTPKNRIKVKQKPKNIAADIIAEVKASVKKARADAERAKELADRKLVKRPKETIGLKGI